jgi:tetratricopeptide (TPR) repeat protein
MSALSGIYRYTARLLSGRRLLCACTGVLMLFCAAAGTARAFQFGAAARQGGGFDIFGRVSLPDGRPAPRLVRVYIVSLRGLQRDTLTNEEGRYEFLGMGAGRYNITASNPEAPDQYCDPILADTERAYSNRLQVDVRLRLPVVSEKKTTRLGTTSVPEAVQEIPKPALKAYEQGLKRQKENRTDLALTAFNQALEIYPDYFQARTERGNLRMQKGDLTGSEADFDRALQSNPDYPPALRGIGYCQIQRKEFEAAIGNLERTHALEPKVPLTLLLLGYANLSLDRYEPAKGHLQQALALGPESAARAHVYLSEVFAHEQNFKEAADEIRAYLKAKPDAADAAHLHKLEADWRARSKAKNDSR